MTSEMTGRIVYANGVAAPGVHVRVFDQDAPGKGDDDLTVTPGLSDASGRFMVLYEPGRYLDFARIPFLGLRRSSNPEGEEQGFRIPDLLDILSPYLQFCYTLEGQERIHKAPLVAFQNEYRLPDCLPIQFQPSQHSFRFRNLFKGYMLPFSVPFFPAEKVPGNYGLCGGMSAAAADFYLSGRKLPLTVDVPRTGSKFHRYLFRRAIDSFAMGETVLRFARWMALPEEGPNGTYHLTYEEFGKVRDALDSQRLVPLGLIFSSGSSLQEISQKVWLNHQVLAYGYREAPDGSVDIMIYDSNCDTDGLKQDEVTLHAERVLVSGPGEAPVFGFRCVERGLTLYNNRVENKVRGFFPMPYEPVEPPEGLG